MSSLHFGPVLTGKGFEVVRRLDKLELRHCVALALQLIGQIRHGAHLVHVLLRAHEMRIRQQETLMAEVSNHGEMCTVLFLRLTSKFDSLFARHFDVVTLIFVVVVVDVVAMVVVFASSS